MKLSILLAGSILTLTIAYNAYALTCSAQPSCDSLGYKYTGETTDCLGEPLKCPFNTSYFNCAKKSEALKNMSLDWDKKKKINLNSVYKATQYGCIFGNILDLGSGTSYYSVNGIKIRASMQAKDSSLIFTCVAPEDTIQATVGVNSDDNLLYFIPYKGN